MALTAEGRTRGGAMQTQTTRSSSNGVAATGTMGNRQKYGKRILRSCMFACALALAIPAAAHNGPPFPIITDQRVGPCIVSLWVHPDVGIGLFFVMVDPLPGETIPKDLKVQIGMQPLSGRLAEVVYPARLED